MGRAQHSVINKSAPALGGRHDEQVKQSAVECMIKSKK